MTARATISQATMQRAIRAAEACGKVAVLAEGGATASQIAAWTGHKTLAEVEHYTREYDRMRAVMG